MELVVPRSRSHMESLVRYNGGPLNILGIYPDFNGASGLNHFSGRCQGQPCDFWLSDTNYGSCEEEAQEPNGNNDVGSSLIRRVSPDCEFGNWDDQGDAMENGGSVVCSTNDAARVPRTCLDAVRREIVINVGGEGAGGQRGVYTLDSDGPEGPLAPYRTWCEGEWTLALKTAANSTFNYESPVWIGASDFNTYSVDLSPVDARFPSYSQIPVGSVLFAMGDATLETEVFWESDQPMGPRRTPESILSIMASGQYLPTRVDRGLWLSMVADRRGGLQPNCNLQGFNAGVPNPVLNLPGGRKVRFGILGNNEMDCLSLDSFIGIGQTGEVACGDPAVISGNNSAPRCGGSGEVNLALPGLLFVREPEPEQP